MFFDDGMRRIEQRWDLDPESARPAPIDRGAQRAIASTIGELRRRAAESGDIAERRRFFAFAESLEQLVDSPTAHAILRQPRIAIELSTHLNRYLTVRKALRHDQAYGDQFLRAAVTAIHMAIGLGRWRANPNVPPQVRELLNADDVYGSILEVEKLDRTARLTHAIERYSSTIRALNEDGRGETGIKVRKPVLWMWCKFNIKNVAYRFVADGARRWPLDQCDERLLDAVADAKVLLVIFNVLLDDVADNLHDPQLLDVLSRIPTASGELGRAEAGDYERLRARLAIIGRDRFAEYFDLCAEIWSSAMEMLAELTGDGFAEHLAELADDYAMILNAMRLSVDLNLRPREIFSLKPAELERCYGGETIGDVLAHNANVAAFYTIDLMSLRNLDPARHQQLLLSGAVDICRRTATISQDMLQLGNSVATGAREIGSDDLSNELFKIANDILNERLDWEQPEHLSSFARRVLLLSLFERKKSLRGVEGAREEYAALGEEVKRLFALSGAERSYFNRWLRRREERDQAIAAAAEFVDRDQLRRGDDLLLVMHLIYKGRI
jgi:hypothetical protein